MTSCSPRTISDRLETGEETAFFWVTILKLIFLINSYNFVIWVIRFCLNRLVGLFTGLDPAEEVLIIGKRLSFLLLLFTLSTTLS